jgi:kinesin family protein 5
LYESLGGNSLTRLIVTCSSEDTEIEETISSLKFASRAKNLKTNPLINTLRKSEKSVSRIAYENLKTNLSKAEYKISKIKGFLTELKNDKTY